MNTLEILYQAFRVRYSLNQLQQLLDRGCRLAILALPEGAQQIRQFLGDPIPALGDGEASEQLIELPYELDEAALKELRTCDAAVVYFSLGSPTKEVLEALACQIPLSVKTMWICSGEDGAEATLFDKDMTVPTVHRLPVQAPEDYFLRILLASLPDVSLVLARDWTRLRDFFCRTLTRRTALRNGVRAGVSALPLRSVPGIGPILAMLATSAETLVLTSSQLRLSFIIAAVHGRPLDFFDRMTELWPIVGGGFGLRSLSRKLVRALPGGFRPGTKASIAFAGTIAIGEASRLFYHLGQPTSDEVRRELLRRSHEEGAKEAQLLFRRILAGQSIEDEPVLGRDAIDLVDDLTSLERKGHAGLPDTAKVGEERLSSDLGEATSDRSEQTNSGLPGSQGRSLVVEREVPDPDSESRLSIEENLDDSAAEATRVDQGASVSSSDEGRESDDVKPSKKGPRGRKPGSKPRARRKVDEEKGN